MSIRVRASENVLFVLGDWRSIVDSEWRTRYTQRKLISTKRSRHEVPAGGRCFDRTRRVYIIVSRCILYNILSRYIVSTVFWKTFERFFVVQPEMTHRVSAEIKHGLNFERLFRTIICRDDEKYIHTGQAGCPGGRKSKTEK